MNTPPVSPLDTLPPEKRMPRLTASIRQKLACKLKRPEAQILLDQSFESMDETWADNLLIYAVLQETIEAQLGRKFYPWEIARMPKGIAALTTIQTLANTLVAGIDIPAPKTTFEDPFTGESFPWKLPSSLVDNTTRNPPMVFLLSSPRAGSTLLRVMLEGHPDLFSPPELYLLLFESMGDLISQTKQFGYEWIQGGIIACLRGLEGLSEVAAQQQLAELIAQDMPTQQVYKILQTKLNNRLLVDKTPVYAINQQWLRRAETIFDDAKYLCLVRHPYAVIESFVRLRFINGILGNHFGVWDDNPWLFAEKWWAATYRNILDFCVKVDSERYHWVRYEDLVAKPMETHTKICHFLNIPFHQHLLEPFEGERMLAFGSNDSNFNNRDRLEPSLANAWRDKRPPQELSKLTQDIAMKFGYKLD